MPTPTPLPALICALSLTLLPGAEDPFLALQDAGSLTLLGSPGRAHGQGPVSVDLSADGLLALSLGADGVLRVLDTRSGEELHAFPDQGEAGARFALNGARIVVRERRGLKVLDVASGEVLPVEGLGEGLGALRVSTDGKRAALTDGEGNLVLVDLTSLEHEVVYAGMGGSASLTWSSDDSLIASCAGANVQVVDVTGPKQLWSARLDRGVQSATFTPDGLRLVCGSDGRLVVWPARDGGAPELLEGPEGRLGRPALSPDGRTAYVGDADGNLVALSLADGAQRYSVPAGDEPLSDLVLSRDGKLLAAGALDGSVRFFDAKDGAELLCGDGHRRAVSAVSWPTGGGVLSAGRDGRLVDWDATAATARWSVEGHGAPVSALALLPDGGLWTAGEDGRVVRRDAQGAEQAVLTLEEEVVATALAALPDGRLLLGTSDGVLFVHDPNAEEGDDGGEALQELDVACSDEVRALVPSPSGTLLAVASSDGVLRVIDARTFEEVLGGGRATYDPWYDALWLDEQRVLVLGPEGELELRSATEGDKLLKAELPSEGEGVGLAALADGPVAVACEDGLWLVEREELSVVRTFDLGGRVPSALSFDATGQHLACGLADGTVAVFHLAR